MSASGWTSLAEGFGSTQGSDISGTSGSTSCAREVRFYARVGPIWHKRFEVYLSGHERLDYTEGWIS